MTSLYCWLFAFWIWISFRSAAAFLVGESKRQEVRRWETMRGEMEGKQASKALCYVSFVVNGLVSNQTNSYPHTILHRV